MKSDINVIFNQIQSVNNKTDRVEEAVKNLSSEHARLEKFVQDLDNNTDENTIKVQFALNSFAKHIATIKAFMTELNVAECETCGCLVKTREENKGESTIETTEDGAEYIKEHYFCKLHKN
jgi:chromosome segregation ATPase